MLTRKALRAPLAAVRKNRTGLVVDVLIDPTPEAVI
jgi:hypothetical protein